MLKDNNFLFKEYINIDLESKYLYIRHPSKSEMEDKQKLDVIDLIINTLREHELSLDNLINRLENMINNFENSKEIRGNPQ